MPKKLSSIIKFFGLMIILALPIFAKADGMIIPPPYYYMDETDQRAVIFYENGIENLIISTSFQGNAKNFAWVVPTPSRPEVSKSSDELFTALDEFTRPAIAYEKQAPLGLRDYAGSIQGGVTIIETKQIDYYDITVLAASDSQSLYDWLKNNGYDFPVNARYILTDYINNGWYFTAIKINAEFVTGNLNDALRTGHAIPLKLTFPAGKIVYPLKISSLDVSQYQNIVIFASLESAGATRVDADGNVWTKQADEMWTTPRYPNTRWGNSMIDALPGGVHYYNNTTYVKQPRTSQINVLLYVFSDHRQDLTGFTTQYAGWVKRDQLVKFATNDQGNPWIKPAKDRYYLTRLNKNFNRSEMSYDLYPRQAATNETVNALEEATHTFFGFYLILWVAGFVTVILVGFLAWAAFSKK